MTKVSLASWIQTQRKNCFIYHGLSPSRIQIAQGKWQWKEADIPLQGGISFQVDNWDNTLSEMVFSGRINMLTSKESQYCLSCAIYSDKFTQC